MKASVDVVLGLFIALFCLLSLSIYLKSRSYGVSSIMLVASGSKLLLCIIGLFYILPFGGTDGVRFERIAWQWSQGSLVDALGTIDVSASYLISSITAVFYSLLGRNIAIPIFINGMLGVLIFYFALVLAREVWGQKRINVSFALLVALHPMLNVHSAIVLRENYIAVFIVLAAIHLARFANQGKKSSIVHFLLFVLLSSFFHGGMILFALGLPMLLIAGRSNISVRNKVAIFAISLTALGFIFTYIDFGKLQDIQDGELSVEYLAQLEARRQDANTAYLRGLAPPSNLVDVVWQAPVRSLFLLAKPFPWDVKSFGHALVLLDAMLWWLMIYLVWKHRRIIQSNPAALAILLGSAVTILAFAYGTGNFGTGVRHRTKFLIMILAVIYPFLPGLRWNPVTRSKPVCGSL